MHISAVVDTGAVLDLPIHYMTSCLARTLYCMTEMSAKLIHLVICIAEMLVSEDVLYGRN